MSPTLLRRGLLAGDPHGHPVDGVEGLGDLFLNMARRSQSLIDRQLELIDELERGETDPVALEELFRLDHLATRMRRNAEDLIVLSGAEPSRRWSDPVVLTDAVRAAIAEVEDYTRVELIPMDHVALVGRAVNDVVHLFAELIENATSFSPPGTKVLVSAQDVNGARLVEIEDRGIGMTETELMETNERLADPAEGDYSLGRRLGFYVVAKLSQRHNIKVQLRPSWYGGVRALVLLPPALIVPLADPDQAASVEPLALMPPSREPARVRASGEPLPIFEAARSDWFDAGEALHHPPVGPRRRAGRHGAHEAGRPRPAPPNGLVTENGWVAGPGGGAGPDARWAQPPAGPGAAGAGPDARWAQPPAGPGAAGAGPVPWAQAPEAPEALAHGHGDPDEWPWAPQGAHEAGAGPGPAAFRDGQGPAAFRDAGAGGAPKEPGASGGAPGTGARDTSEQRSGARGAGRRRWAVGRPAQPSGPGQAAPPPGRGRARRRAAPDRPGAVQPAPPSEGGLPRRPVRPREDDLSGPVPPLRSGATRSGLPRRVPRANLAPGIARQGEPPSETAPQLLGEPGGRSPDGVRDTLSRYRSGLERGRSAVSAGEAAAMTGPFDPSQPGPANGPTGWSANDPTGWSTNGNGGYPEELDDAW